MPPSSPHPPLLIRSGTTYTLWFDFILLPMNSRDYIIVADDVDWTARHPFFIHDRDRVETWELAARVTPLVFQCTVGWTGDLYVCTAKSTTILVRWGRCKERWRAQVWLLSTILCGLSLLVRMIDLEELFNYRSKCFTNFASFSWE